MLSDQERAEIEAAIADLPSRESGSIDALRIIQEHRRWVSDEAISDLAPVLGMTQAGLDSVATFYSLIFRKPVGEHVIFVCDSVSCWIMGEERVMDYLRKKLGIQLGQTTEDGMFTLLPVACLGHCEQAPVMMLDGEIIGDLTEQKIDSTLANALKQSREK